MDSLGGEYATDSASARLRLLFKPVKAFKSQYAKTELLTSPRYLGLHRTPDATQEKTAESMTRCDKLEGK